MRKPKYRIELANRTVALVAPGGSSVKLDDATAPLPFVDLFEAVRTALTAVARREGFARGQEIQWNRFADDDIPFRLEVAGSEDELRVAAFYLENEFGLSPESSPLQELGSVYDTFCLAADLEPLDALAARYQEFVACNNGLKFRNSFRNFGDIVQSDFAHKGKLKLAVVGQTGVGKSTFLNAIVGRPVLPLHGLICTGTIIEIHAPKEAADEGTFSVFYIKKKVYEGILHTERARLADMQKVFKGPDVPVVLQGAEVSGWEFQDRIFEQEERLQKIVDAWDSKSQPNKRIPLSKLTPYVSVAGGNVLPELVASVSISLDAPILQFASLIDTPGLRDPNHLRSERTLGAIAGSDGNEVDGWLYLVSGSDPQREHVHEDIAAIREVANVPDGVIVMTHADGRALETIRETADLYSTSANAPTVLCCARTASEVDRLPSLSTTESEQTLRDLLSESYGYSFLRKVMPANAGGLRDPMRSAYEGKLDEVLQGIASGDDRPRVELTNLHMEASGIIGVIRTIANLLEQTIVLEKVRRGEDSLKDAAQRRLSWLDDQKRFAMKELETWDSITDSESLLHDRRATLKAASERKAEFDNVSSECLASIEKKRSKIAAKLKLRHGELLKRIPSAVEKELNKAYSLTLTGTREVSLHEMYDKELAKSASQYLKTFGNQSIKSVAEAHGKGWVSDHSLRAKVDNMLRGYSLLDGKFKVKTTEKLTELFSTTVKRLVGKAEKAAGNHRINIAYKADKRAQKVEKVIRRVLDDESARLTDVVQEKEKQVQELAEHINDLRNNVKRDRSALESKLKSLEADRAALTAYKRKLHALRVSGRP